MIELQNKLYRLIEPECEKHFGHTYDGAMEDYRLLLAELLRLNAEDQLFTFVTTADTVRPNGTTMKAEGTNNEAERTLQLAASARNTDSVRKTISGARRRTVIVSTIESIRCFVHRFNLDNVVQEILSWQQHGTSCFERRLNSIKESIRCDAMLGKLYPKPA